MAQAPPRLNEIHAFRHEGSLKGSDLTQSPLSRSGIKGPPTKTLETH